MGSAAYTEIRDGQEFRVTVLPEVKPDPKRWPRSKYSLKDVGKEGSLARERASGMLPSAVAGRPKRRRPKR